MFPCLYGSLTSIGRCSVDIYNYFCSHSYMCKVLSVHSIFQQLPADCLFSELLACTSPGYNINFDASKHYHTLSMIAHGVLFWFAACQSLLGIITENISPTIKDATFTLLVFFHISLPWTPDFSQDYFPHPFLFSSYLDNSQLKVISSTTIDTVYMNADAIKIIWFLPKDYLKCTFFLLPLCTAVFVASMKIKLHQNYLHLLIISK